MAIAERTFEESRAARAALVDEIAALHRLISSSQRRLLGLVAELDSSEAYAGDGCKDASQWISGHLGISRFHAHRVVDCAHAIEGLPATGAALESGTLSLDKTVQLIRFATPDSERRLIPWARRVSVRALRERADRAVRVELEDAQEAEMQRSFRWWSSDDGAMTWFEGRFPAAEGAVVVKAVSRAAERLDKLCPDKLLEGLEWSSEDGYASRCADALWALCSQAIAADADADRATVVIHAALDSDGLHSGHLEGASTVHDSVLERLACDGRLQFVLTAAEGNALGIGHTDRNPPPWLARQVRYRDQGCTFPGCGTRAFTHCHHIVRWPLGPTQYDNLVTVCFFHHKLVHEGGWEVVLVGDEAIWLRPDGSRYLPGPDP